MAIIISKNGKNAVRVDKSDFDKEDYLQKYIYENPESIPLYDIKEDIKLLILAREFPTNSGPIDAIGIDKDGEIYIVETKLYKNPDKRTVIAQALDYGAALWKHSGDASEFISILDDGVQKKFKIPLNQKLREYFGLSDEELKQLLDSVKNNLSGGVLHFVILMDSLDARLKDLILYVNQNSQFDIYAVEFEYYKHDTYEIIIPRIFGAEVKKGIGGGGSGRGRKEFEPWWEPILNMKFDDPEQEAPHWEAPNQVVLETPCPSILIKAAKNLIYLSSPRGDNWKEVDGFIASEWKEVKKEIPDIRVGKENENYFYLHNDSKGTDDQQREWLKKNLNTYVNILRPRLKKWHEEKELKKRR